MLNRLFGFDILDKEIFRESRNISQGRTPSDISEYTAVGKTRGRYLKQGRRIRTTKPSNEGS
jgi:hypothetical protein